MGAASDPVRLERRRTGWDIVLGVLSVLAGGVVLGHVAVAGAISMLFIGWMLVIGGVALAVEAIVDWRIPSQRWNLAAGALLVILGVGLLRNPAAGLLVLTLLAGSMLVIGGIVRLVAAFQPGSPRAFLIVNGAVTLLLGFLVLNRWPVSALWFLGTVLGVQLVVDGVTTAIAGRVRTVGTERSDTTPSVQGTAG